MRSTKPHVRLAIGWARSPRVKKAWVSFGDSAPLMWSLAVEYCNDQRTDGRISFAALVDCTRHQDPRAVIAALVDAGAFIEVGKDEWEVRGFLEHNQSKAEREALESKRRANASMGGKRTAARGYGTRRSPRSKLLDSSEANTEQGAKQSAEQVAQQGAATQKQHATVTVTDTTTLGSLDLGGDLGEASTARPAKQPSDVSKLWSRWSELHLEHRGRPPVDRGAAENKAMSEAVKKLELPDAIRRLENAFTDPWFVDNGSLKQWGFNLDKYAKPRGSSQPNGSAGRGARFQPVTGGLWQEREVPPAPEDGEF